MYSRDVKGKVRRFEPSGSLYHSALVMKDSATNSYWAVISSQAIGGPDSGTALAHLPISEKTTWGAWRAKHPGTLVLSVDGAEDVRSNPYEHYFGSDDTFRGAKSKDPRLPDKEPIFAFRLGARSFAVPHRSIEGGWRGEAAGTAIILHRPKGASIYQSTSAHRAGGEGGAGTPLEGVDTFWYVWSNYYPRTEILGGTAR